MEKSQIGISGFALKWIAIITMGIDHIGAVLYPQYIILRIIGRISFPIFCFLLVEGVLHTHNIRKYIKRLFLFALISELPFDLAFYGKIMLQHQNVFFTLCAGVIMLAVLEYRRNNIDSLLVVIGTILLTETVASDYGAGGILIILCFYVLYRKHFLKQAAFAGVNLLYYGTGVQAYAGLAAVPLLFYNGKQGRSMKYFFYLFYPVHLLILYLIIRL